MTWRHAILALLLAVTTTPAAAEVCRWREPPRSYAEGEAWRCLALRWADGDTLTAACVGQSEPVRVRVRGVDTVERGDPRWGASRLELVRRTQQVTLEVLPHHRSGTRVVGDVLVRGEDVGRAMDAEGWSKVACPKR